MSGEVGILNVGAGDTKLSFDPKNPAERIRAARIVKDMIRRGYALLIEVGTDADGQPRYARAKDFDENTCEYIIADFDPEIAAVQDQREKEIGEAKPSETAEEIGSGSAPAPVASKRRGRSTGVGSRKVPAESTRGVAVARTAGG